MGYAMADDDPARGGADFGVGRGPDFRDLAERVRALAGEGVGRVEIVVVLGWWMQAVSERGSAGARVGGAMGGAPLFAGALRCDLRWAAPSPSRSACHLPRRLRDG